MSWLSRVRNGIPFLPKRQTSENLWHKCGKCGTMVFVKEWEENYSVCPRCNFHDRIGPRQALRAIVRRRANMSFFRRRRSGKTRCGSAIPSAIPIG